VSERDLARVLLVRAEAVKAVAYQSYDQAMREAMYKTAHTFEEAAAEIGRLRARIAELELSAQANTPQKP
jgi:hypothetical protein